VGHQALILTEYAHAKYHKAWVAGQDTNDVVGDVTMLSDYYDYVWATDEGKLDCKT